MKIFVNDTLLYILRKPKNISAGIYLKTNSAETLIRIYESVKAGQHPYVKNYYFETSEYQHLVSVFKKHFQIIEAAGGIVLKNDKVLFIKRLGKWDLPKGKIDKGEKIEQAALREVEEECGVRTEIIKKIGKTWHTFVQKDDKLKCTHWFLMNCLDDKKIKPQAEEYITEVKWLSEHEVEEALKNTYQSIQLIYNKFKE